jgi:hypothetical protein
MVRLLVMVKDGVPPPFTPLLFLAVEVRPLFGS